MWLETVRRCNVRPSPSGACIFAKFPEASAHMREIICSLLVKMNSKFSSANLSIIIWALRSLWKIGCGSSNLHSFSTYLAQHAAIHADAAAPRMLSHHRHHVVGALYQLDSYQVLDRALHAQCGLRLFIP